MSIDFYNFCPLAVTRKYVSNNLISVLSRTLCLSCDVLYVRLLEIYIEVTVSNVIRVKII